MALAVKAQAKGYFRNVGTLAAKHDLSPFDSPRYQVPMRRETGRVSERMAKPSSGQFRACSQLGKRNVSPEIGVDMLKHHSQSVS
jgi:hypothetical protein